MFGDLLQYNDIHCTWEGDNNVLRMQTQKYLLKALKDASEGKKLPPTLEYLSLNQFERPVFTGSLSSTDDLITLFKQVASHLAIKAATKLTTCGLPMMEAFAKFQHFELKKMCESYLDVYMVENFNTFLQTITDANTKEVFEKMLLLHFSSRINEGGDLYCHILGEELCDQANDQIQQLCHDLRGNIIEMIKILPVGNRLMGALGNEDLQVYKRLMQHVHVNEGVTERPGWWKLLYQNRK